MEVADIDPLAVLPVTASARAAFARAADFSRDRDERQKQLRSLTTTPGSGEPTTVVLRDAIGTEQALCLSHPAAALRHITCLTVVTTSRPARDVLGEVNGQNCVSSPPVPPLVQGGPRGG
jgi:hypothetical protein